MQIPFEKARMAAALRYLETLISSPPAPFRAETPVVVLLQEMCESDIRQILKASWVQDRFAVTDLNHTRWPNLVYGTTTLVDRRLALSGVFRVPLWSRFGRDALFVDVSVPVDTERRTVRLCNVHLESLHTDVPVRPVQVAAIAKYLHVEGVHAGLLAGDTNAIQPHDREIAAANNLTDAYLALGGEEDSEEGYTWGYQSPAWLREKHGCSRLDKLMLCGGMDVSALTRIGIDVRVEDEADRHEMREQGIGEWVTDHYGLLVGVKLLENRRGRDAQDPEASPAQKL
jgi:tyrosyl-DNA phosphodiesterase 2